MIPDVNRYGRKNGEEEKLNNPDLMRGGGNEERVSFAGSGSEDRIEGRTRSRSRDREVGGEVGQSHEGKVGQAKGYGAGPPAPRPIIFPVGPIPYTPDGIPLTLPATSSSNHSSSNSSQGPHLAVPKARPKARPAHAGPPAPRPIIASPMGPPPGTAPPAPSSVHWLPPSLGTPASAAGPPAPRPIIPVGPPPGTPPPTPSSDALLLRLGEAVVSAMGAGPAPVIPPPTTPSLAPPYGWQQGWEEGYEAAMQFHYGWEEGYAACLADKATQKLDILFDFVSALDFDISGVGVPAPSPGSPAKPWTMGHASSP